MSPNFGCPPKVKAYPQQTMRQRLETPHGQRRTRLPLEYWSGLTMSNNFCDFVGHFQFTGKSAQNIREHASLAV